MQNLRLNQILQEVQETSQHEIHIRKFTEIYKKMNHDEFMSTIIKKGLDRWIKFDNNIDFAENGVTSLISFAIFFETDKTNDVRPVLTSILDHLFEISHKKSYIVRKRVCQILLRLFGERRDIIRQEVLEKIKDCMKVLINDPSKTVRMNAINFMLNLDENENVLAVLLLHLESDPAKDVRILILNSLIPSKESLAKIVSRTKDVKAEIRFLALKLLRKYDIIVLTVAERLQILSCGLNDSTEKIKEYFSAEILPYWLQQFGDNHFELLSNFMRGSSKDEIIEFHSISKRILKLFQGTSLIKLAEELPLSAAEPFSNCVPFNKLTIGKAVCWSALIEVAGKNTFNGSTETLICDLTTFCEYIIKFIQFTGEDEETIENLSEEEIQFILLILIKMIRKLDNPDEYTRNVLIEFIGDLLKNHLDYLTEETIHILVTYARKLLPYDHFDEYFTNLIDNLRILFQPDVLERISTITEMIDDETQRMNIFTMKQQVFGLNETLINTMDSKMYEKLDEIWLDLDFWYQSIAGILRQNTPFDEESEINKIIPDFSMAKLDKYLYIASSALMQIPPSASDIRLTIFFEEFIQPFLEYADLHIRGIAIKCGASLAVRHRNMAKNIMTKCYQQILANQNVQIWRIALAALVDLSNLHNIHISFHDGEKDVPLDDILVGMIDSIKQPELVKILAKGAGFMILNGYIQNPLLIGKMLVYYFNPKTMTLLQQILHYLFVIMQRQEEKFDILVRSLRSALELIVNAPHESGMHEIKIANLVGLVAFQTRNFPEHQKNIAIILLKMIVRDIPRNLKRDLSKQLESLRFLPLVDENMREMFMNLIDNIFYDAEHFIKKKLMSFKKNINKNSYFSQDSSDTSFTTIERLSSSPETTERNRSTSGVLFEIPSRKNFNSTRIRNSLDVLDTFNINEFTINSPLNGTTNTSRSDIVSPRHNSVRSELRCKIFLDDQPLSENEAEKLKQKQPIRPSADKENHLRNSGKSQIPVKQRRVAFLNAVNILKRKK